MMIEWMMISKVFMVGVKWIECNYNCEIGDEQQPLTAPLYLFLINTLPRQSIGPQPEHQNPWRTPPLRLQQR